jgi:hypothetical protein
MTKPKSEDITQRTHYTDLRGKVLYSIRDAEQHGATAETAQSAVTDALQEVYPELEKNR